MSEKNSPVPSQIRQFVRIRRTGKEKINKIETQLSETLDRKYGKELKPLRYLTSQEYEPFPQKQK